MLFCPNCGKSVSKNDNYCPLCGKQLKNVKVRIERAQEDTFDPSESMDKTRIFNLKSLDGIDTTDNIKDIIHAVDKKVSKNIKKYETQNNKKITDDLMDELNEEKKETSVEKEESVNSSSHKSTDEKKAPTQKETVHRDKSPSKDQPMTQSELVRRVQEELKKSGYQEIDDKTYPKKQKESIEKDLSPKKDKKKSLKALWKDFVNEDDDEYSIFSSLNEEPKSEASEKERNLEVSSTTPDRGIEDTMSVPKIVIPPEEQIEDSKSVMDKGEKKSSFATQRTMEDQNTHHRDVSTSQDKMPTHSSFQQKWKKWKTKSKKDRQKPISSKFQKDSTINEEKDYNPSDAPENSEKSSDLFTRCSPCFQRLHHYLNQGVDTLGTFKTREYKIALISGIIMTAFPILLAQRKIRLSFLFFVIIKLIFDYFQFLTPLNITTDRAWIDTSIEEVKNYSLVNWLICKAFLLIAFILSPWGGFFQFQLLGALTPMPIATIILFILTLVIAMAEYWPQLKNQSKVNFIGWYWLTFILFELLFKLFWFFINFIFNTLF
ncbi:MAG: zinc-ribbon domain-containing protein [Tissierellia bacterium]|nr:zinc-ribbon domain-containing protein [Tissierellia bacterium]